VHAGHFVGLLDDAVRHLLAPLDRLEDAAGRHQGRHQPGVVGQHQLDRLVVQVHAVLDRPDAGPQRVLDPGRGLRVGHDVGAGCPGDRDDLLDLVGQELRQLGIGGG
jgi:hypothetical protein